MVALPDVNVLVALVWPTHVHHDAAHEWFEEHGTSDWATCPLTQSGFVRVSSNSKTIPEAKSPRDAIQALDSMLAHPRHVFLADDVSIADRRLIAIDRLVGYRQVTDMHLLGIALRNSVRLVTLDRNIASLVPPGFDREKAVALITSRS
jgi:toxin-antitoxin system PIN domain toxin